MNMTEDSLQSKENFALLVEIKTKLERVITDVAKLNDTLVIDIANLQTGKADKLEVARLVKDGELTHADFETRLRSVESWRWKVVGIVIAANAIIGAGIAILAAYIARGH